MTVVPSDHFINIEDVFFSYPQSNLLALDGASLSVKRSEFACILGPSGCGKSTLLNILSGLFVPSKGRVTIDGDVVFNDGQMASGKLPRIGYVFQDDRLLPWRSVRQNIELALKSAAIPKSEWDGLVEHFLGLCGIGQYADTWPGNLSGGQRKRAAIARAMAIDPTSLLMDEPFSTLDEVNARFLRRELLELWQKTKQTILFVTHSVREAVYLADTIYIMTKGPGKVMERLTIDVARPRQYEDPRLTEIEGSIISSVLNYWGYYEPTAVQG
ncbi:MAG: ABC transporter ATP-binding protein [Chloroflexi bacterium]|nr:ABC transporter ATP-binding protein [Chloroflexota bacterium]